MINHLLRPSPVAAQMLGESLRSVTVRGLVLQFDDPSQGPPEQVAPAVINAVNETLFKLPGQPQIIFNADTASIDAQPYEGEEAPED